jgi:hypothetical protein
MKKYIMALVVALSATAFWGCNDSDPKTEPAETFGNVEFEVEHVWGHAVSTSEPFSLNTPFVHPKTGDTLSFTKVKYYISNVSFQKTDGSWVDMDQYFLLDLAEGNKIKVENVPSGEYTAMKMMIGVDSLRNVSGAQEGALSPSNGMFWSWNTGYIMAKLEGESPNAEEGSFAFHIGGFEGEYAVQTTNSFDFSSMVLKVSENSLPVVHFAAFPTKAWMTAPSVSERSKFHVPGEAAYQMASGFFSTFELQHVHN